MTAPQVTENHDPNLATQCLVFIQTLVNQKIGFNFHLTSGQFSCSFDSNRTVTAAVSARIPTEAKKKSPSTRKRNAKRLQLFLENKHKKSGSPSVSVECGSPAQSACENPPQHVQKQPPQPSAQKEPTQPLSDSLRFSSSSESLDLSPKNHITKKMRMEEIPPLRVVIDRQSSSPKYRIQQFDGNCSLSDLSLSENDQLIVDGSYGSDTKDTIVDKHSDILCAMCNYQMTPTHQCCETSRTQPKSELNDFMTLCKCEQILVYSWSSAGFSDERIEKMLQNIRLSHVIPESCFMRN